MAHVNKPIYVTICMGIAFLLSSTCAEEEPAGRSDNGNRYMNHRDWMKPSTSYPRPPRYHPSNSFAKLFSNTPSFQQGQGDSRGNSNVNPNTGSSAFFFPETNIEDTTTTRPSSESTSCERNCAKTQEFNPVCGSDGSNYTNMGHLRCAQSCGRRVSMSYYGNCREVRTTARTPTGMLISPEDQAH